VAAAERRVNRTVYKLLKGYLLRSVWLYAFLGLAQFSLTGVSWLRGWGRMPIAAAALGLWGAAAALNANSLVWRSLPLTSRDASLFRWWAMAGAPGFYVTLLTGLIWTSQRSSGFPTATPDVIWEGIFANWAVLGVAAVLFRAPAFYRRALRARTLATLTCATLLLCYGVPVGPAARPYSIVFIAIGMVLLLISGVQAHRGRHWRWPDVTSRPSTPVKARSAGSNAHRYGIWTVLLPLLQRTSIVALIGTALVVALHVVFPRADAALFWVYFVGISTAGFLLTFQFRSALQPLRCLPLSTKQLAGLLLVFGALPGVATLGLTLLINRALLNVDMDFTALGAAALIIIASQALPLRQENRRVHAAIGRWLVLIQRISLPVYIGVMAASLTYSGAFEALWWLRWGLIAAGVGLCLSGYFILVYQLRGGITPSSNEKIFSPG
jgi:multisubunit Na+/H+ antiporter MnhG subunit